MRGLVLISNILIQSYKNDNGLVITPFDELFGDKDETPKTKCK